MLLAMPRPRFPKTLNLLLLVGVLAVFIAEPHVAGSFEYAPVEAPALPPPDLEHLEQTATAWYSAAQENRQQYALWLVQVVDQKRAFLHHTLAQRTMERRQHTTDTCFLIFRWLAWLSLLYLLLPLIFWRRYAERRLRFSLHCGLCAGLLAVTFIAFGLLISNGSPERTARTRSGKIRSSAQSPPPITLPALPDAASGRPSTAKKLRLYEAKAISAAPFEAL